MSPQWKGKQVVVTGGTGFIGSFLVEKLLDAGAHVRVPVRAANYRALSERRSEVEWLEGDMRDSKYCAELVKDCDHIFHAASHRRNVDYHRKYCGDVAVGNVLMTVALLDGLKEVKSKASVTFFSTANVPQTNDVLALSQSEKIDGYMLGKALCETLWFASAKQRKFPLLILRPVGVYGPRDTFSEDGNVIPSLMVRARDSEKELIVWGSGEQERAFLYVEDLIGAIFTLIEAQAQGIQYVVPPDIVTVKDLAERIKDLVKTELVLTFDTTKPEGQRSLPRLAADASLDSFLWTELHEGLKRTVDWWRAPR